MNRFLIWLDALLEGGAILLFLLAIAVWFIILTGN